ncbi:MAG TPA: hexokinase [Bacillota bacterium]|nr:hexokinase [Bacillota bacterium]
MASNLIREKVYDFLRENKMDHQGIDFDSELNTFLKDMTDGLKGEDSSLDMLPTYISLEDDIKTNERVIVIDAGGTNFRVATVYFNDDKEPVIEDFNNYPMPGIKEEICRDEFFDTIVKYISPVLDKSDKVGFCFSYPTEILPSGDGRLIRFSKEIRVRDMIGQAIGQGVLQAAEKAGHKADKKMVILNDTVSTLLGGRTTYPNRSYSSYVGFILGTGTNTCYIDNVGNIEKIGDRDRGFKNMLINMESGGYGKAPTGIIDDGFDATTINPNQSRFEKMISGAYLYGLLLALFKKAAKVGLFSSSLNGQLGKLDDFTAFDTDAFLDYPYGDNLLSNICSQDPAEGALDRQTLYFLIDACIERAAKLVALNLTAVAVKSGAGTDPTRPICITADGSTFYKLKSMEEKIQYYVKKHMVDDRGLYYEFVKADNPNLIGSAIAALSR